MPFKLASVQRYMKQSCPDPPRTPLCRPRCYRPPPPPARYLPLLRGWAARVSDLQPGCMSEVVGFVAEMDAALAVLSDEVSW